MSDPNKLDEVIQFELEDLFDTLIIGINKGKWTAYECEEQLDNYRLSSGFYNHRELIGDLHV